MIIDFRLKTLRRSQNRRALLKPIVSALREKRLRSQIKIFRQVDSSSVSGAMCRCDALKKPQGGQQ